MDICHHTSRPQRQSRGRLSSVVRLCVVTTICFDITSGEQTNRLFFTVLAAKKCTTCVYVVT